MPELQLHRTSLDDCSIHHETAMIAGSADHCEFASFQYPTQSIEPHASSEVYHNLLDDTRDRASYGTLPVSQRENAVDVSIDEVPAKSFLVIQVQKILVNLASGLMAFLLSSTLAVSCAAVIVGHGTPLSSVVANFIDMNILGTSILSIVLAWRSRAPWSLGQVDVFVAPIMGSMAAQISDDLDGDLDKVVPTTIVMVALTSVFLGALFLIMGAFRITSIANYVPYPVIAGFLSGIGLQLMNNGLHMSSSLVFTRQVFTVQQLLLLFPALCFVALTRRAKHRNWPVAMSFPVILIASFVGFHIVTLICGNSMEELQTAGWVFEWSAQVVAQSPMWHPWTSIDFGLIQWGVLAQEGVSFTVPLVILGAIKYSVAATSLSTVFSRDISADNEMKIVGVANLLCGALGSCGGCHYLPAMGIMKQIAGHEKVPAVVCSVLLLLLWVQGIQLLELVPKFIFGGLLLSVGMTFLDSFFFAPLQFLKPMEVAVLGFITSSFLVIGMLESVSLGILISMIELLYYIHQVGCVYLETTGITMQSATPRSSDELTALQVQGDAIFILRLQGFLFFGTSAKILKRIKRRVEKAELQQVQFVVLDFSLVPNFDARALLNLRKVSSMTDKFGFDIHLCGLTPQIEIPLRRNHTYSSRVHFRPGFDATLRVCEDQLLERANHGL